MIPRELIVNTGGGLTSCLSVRLHEFYRFYEKHGQFPQEIDSQWQFAINKDFPGQDLSKQLLGNYSPNGFTNCTHFDHGYQFRWYDDINIETIATIAQAVCRPSQKVLDKAYIYKTKIGNRTAILFRGNEKRREIPETPYQAMLDMARISESSEFVVLTDEKNFYDYFRSVHINTIKFDDLPMRPRDTYNTFMPHKGERLQFSVNFIAALYAISSQPKLIINTGNTGLWAVLWRGNINNVWQFHGQEQTWKKLQ